jgi:hypothetical protein
MQSTFDKSKGTVRVVRSGQGDGRGWCSMEIIRDIRRGGLRSEERCQYLFETTPWACVVL